MIRRRVRFAIACPLLFLASLAEAQISNGTTRVRLVNVKNGRSLVAGTLAGQIGDSVAIVPDSSDGLPQRFVVGAQYRLEHSAGIFRRTGEGFALGALLGASAGALYGTTTYRRPDCPRDEDFCRDLGSSASSSGYALLFGVAGAVLGAVSGHNTVREVWRSRPDDRTRVAFRPAKGGGVRVAALVTF